MPIISEIGKRSVKVRLLYGAIYVILLLGSISMIYPLLLMLSGSVKSEADSWSIKPYPEFWFNDVILFQKYAEAKYNNQTMAAQRAWCRPVLSWRSVEKPDNVDPELVHDFRTWRENIPVEERLIGSILNPGMLPKNLRSYRKYMAGMFKGDLTAYNATGDQSATSWSNVRLPSEMLGRYLNLSIPHEFRGRIAAWKGKIPAEDIIVEGAGGQYALEHLYGVYTSRIDAYNQVHGSSYKSYGEIKCPEKAPEKPGKEREDWAKFVRNDVRLRYVRLDASLEKPFRNFIASQYETITIFNKEHGTDLQKFEDIPFPENIDKAPYLRRTFEAFIKSAEICPLESMRIYSADQSFEDFMARKYGTIPGSYPGLGAVCAATDWADCMENSAAVRWEFSKRNYWQVIDYVAMHGNGLLNTLIFCSLAVLTALIVNPLAAYALSRFRLPGTYKILLFCMATMAFPGEVTMIPGFLLVKKFPLIPILGGVATTIIVFLLLENWLPNLKENMRGLISLASGLAIGALAIPALGPDVTYVSLINNFAALILPGMANGFSIFLLKGFFDSMPKELYEAADIDGASEWTKFWMLTMNISKPILAVIALGAFTGAYSAFMMALIIIPDQKMWTIMVWIFQLQSQAHQSVIYASLVVAAIPTFIIFVLCQNVIMRGIVVPTEK